MTTQSLWVSVNAVLRGKFTAKQETREKEKNKKQEEHQINNQT